MNAFSYSLVAFVAIAGLAGTAPAQPAPDPVPTDQTPEQPVAPDATPPPSPSGDAVAPPDTPPPDVAPPPPTPPPPPAGLVVSSATDQRLLQHSHAFDGETPLVPRLITASLFADYWFERGPRVGGSIGVYRAFELHVGAIYETQTMTTTFNMKTTTSETRFMYGGTLGLISYGGIQLSGGVEFLTGQGQTMQPVANLAVALDAHWLPFRVSNTWLRVGYPISVGLEWGKL